MNVMSLEWLKRTIWPRKSSPTNTFDEYVSSTPSWQNAIDAVVGWNTSFPPHFHLRAGSLATYNDPRILWAIQNFGSLENRHVLELGPLEGGHTSMLEEAGARVDAIEANQRAFLRCLIAKEIMGLKQSRFWLGDFIEGLKTWERNYDLIVACGVLYHLTNPLKLIDLIAERTDAAYFWTHVVTEEAMPPSDPRRLVIAPDVETHQFHGLDVRAYRRTYANAQQNVTFCGGLKDEHRWLHRDDLLQALKVVGFAEIRTAHEEPDHPYGPALSIFARK
jgi:2-polyprenyl-3-methyl-5-hydroxy-6-metoxy-1,4-benzoquinol methylase